MALVGLIYSHGFDDLTGLGGCRFVAHRPVWAMKKLSIKLCVLVTLGFAQYFIQSAGVAIAQPGFLKQPVKAPAWAIEEWVVGPKTSLEQLKGKVVIVDFFQLWCPGCNSFSIPLMNHWEKKFSKQKADGKIAFVSIHTVFEGHSYQNNERLKAFVKKKGIHHPVGVDARKKGARIPITMDRYNTYGTPEIAIIDKQGRIRFQKFGGFDRHPVEKLIQKLMNEKSVAEVSG